MKVLVVNGADFSENGIINVVTYGWLMGATNTVISSASSRIVNDTQYVLLVNHLAGPKLISKIKCYPAAAGTINFYKFDNSNSSHGTEVVATVTIDADDVGNVVTKDLSTEIELASGEQLSANMNGILYYKGSSSDDYVIGGSTGAETTISIYVDVYCATPLT